MAWWCQATSHYPIIWANVHLDLCRQMALLTTPLYTNHILHTDLHSRGQICIHYAGSLGMNYGNEKHWLEACPEKQAVDIYYLLLLPCTERDIPIAGPYGPQCNDWMLLEVTYEHDFEYDLAKGVACHIISKNLCLEWKLYTISKWFEIASGQNMGYF